MRDLDFDPEQAVIEYRRVIAQRKARTTDVGRADYEGIVKRMRAAWTEWQGEDSLHEMAFGEPDESPKE